MDTYSILDSGEGKKLEKIGPHIVIRPSQGAVWQPLYEKKWKDADAIFQRDQKGWNFKNKIPSSWNVEIENILFKVTPTEFGHLGIFPEHSFLWNKIYEKIKNKKGLNILNLFAYTGGATLFLAKHGAKVCHVDASRPTVSWAKENAKLNKLEKAPIRWIVDDAMRFIKKEEKRGVKYDGIILDPPTFGRGPKNEVFKIERDIYNMCQICFNLLSKKALFFILSSHSPGFSKTTLKNLLGQVTKKDVEADEMFLDSKGLSLPSGNYAMWS